MKFAPGLKILKCFSFNVGVLLNYVVVELGPVVQSMVSLTSSLRGQLVKCFTTL